MTRFKSAFAVLAILVSSLTVAAQSAELLSKLPTTKDEFIASEPNVLATIDWIENTPINQEPDKHKEQFALLVGWITNSPTVTLEINADILTFTKKNSELLIVFMAGWTKYCLQNNYSKDNVQGSIAGIKSALKVYKTGLLKKDKEAQNLADLEEKGELEKWVAEKMKKK